MEIVLQTIQTFTGIIKYLSIKEMENTFCAACHHKILCLSTLSKVTLSCTASYQFLRICCEVNTCFFSKPLELVGLHKGEGNKEG